MNKQEFLSQLRSGLSGLPQTDIEGHIGFYGEMIDDRIEEGVPEEEAVRQIGTVEEVIEEIIAETPLTKLVKEKVKPKRALKAWEIVLIILGSPIWLPLLIGAAAVILSLYIVLWALIVSMWAVEIALIASVFVSLTAAVMLAVRDSPRWRCWERAASVQDSRSSSSSDAGRRQGASYCWRKRSL